MRRQRAAVTAVERTVLTETQIGASDRLARCGAEPSSARTNHLRALTHRRRARSYTRALTHRQRDLTVTVQDNWSTIVLRRFLHIFLRRGYFLGTIYLYARNITFRFYLMLNASNSLHSTVYLVSST